MPKTPFHLGLRFHRQYNTLLSQFSRDEISNSGLDFSPENDLIFFLFFFFAKSKILHDFMQRLQVDHNFNKQSSLGNYDRGLIYAYIVCNLFKIVTYCLST